MKIIDAHIHFSNIESFRYTAEKVSGVDYSSSGLRGEYESSNVVMGIGMGVTELRPGGFPDYASPNPMNLDLEDRLPEFIACCTGINPMKLQGDEMNLELERIEQELVKKQTVGIKIYAGYYPFHVYDVVYEPIYDLALKYNLTVVIHGGATYSDRGYLKYSHPLNVDQLAVTYPDIRFVVCHLGDPWVMDTAAVVAKNSNVFTDLSGLLVQDVKGAQRFMGIPLFMDHVKRSLIYADKYDKFLFGTDWPLVPVGACVNFVKELVPEEYWNNVFFNNVLNVFPKLKLLLDEK